jgi:REP element-mobilizing transposase RayT
VNYPNAVYHVTARGNGRGTIFFEDADRHRFLRQLCDSLEADSVLLYAYVLMDNHDHLFLETPEANLSAGMHYFNGSYTSYFNRRHDRVGHLFQGRFKGHLIEQTGYFLEVSRYIHLNPVRAKIVVRPADYRWSSYSGYVRAAGVLPWVTYSRVLADFGRKTTLARREYARFVRAGVAEPVPSPFAGAFGGLLVGSERFIAKMRRLLRDRPDDKALPQLAPLRSRPPLQQIAETVAAHFGHDLGEWQPGRRVDDASRAVAAYLARRRFGHPAAAVAAALGFGSHGGVHNALKRVETGSDELKTVTE